MSARSLFRPAPATFIGMQDGFHDQSPFELFTLNAPVGDHPVGSTVSRRTLEQHGFFVPAPTAKVDSTIGKKPKLKAPRAPWGMATA